MTKIELFKQVIQKFKDNREKFTIQHDQNVLYDFHRGLACSMFNEQLSTDEQEQLKSQPTQDLLDKLDSLYSDVKESDFDYVGLRFQVLSSMFYRYLDVIQHLDKANLINCTDGLIEAMNEICDMDQQKLIDKYSQF